MEWGTRNQGREGDKAADNDMISSTIITYTDKIDAQRTLLLEPTRAWRHAPSQRVHPFQFYKKPIIVTVSDEGRMTYFVQEVDEIRKKQIVTEVFTKHLED